MYCTHCGAPNTDTGKFCMQCGKPLLAPVAPAAAPPPPMRTPSSALTAAPPVVHIEPMTRRRRWLPWVAGGLVLLLVLCLGTASLARTWLHIGTNDAVKLMPENTSMLLSISPNPLQLRQWQRLQTVAGAFGAAVNTTGALPSDLLGTGLDINLQKDVLPWMGFELAAGVTDIGQGEPGLLAAMAMRSASGAHKFTDKVRGQLEAKGRTFAEETYQGVDITYQVADSSTGGRSGIAYSQTNGFLLLGSSLDAVHQAVDAVQGRSPALSKSKVYQKVLKALDGNRAGYAYIDWATFQRALNLSEGSPLSVQLGLEGVGAALVLEADGIRMDYALAYDTGALSAGQRKALTASADPNRILATIPADLLFAATGQQLRNSFDQVSEALRTTGQDPESAIREIEQALNLDLERDVFAWANGEYAVALIEDSQGLLGDTTTPFSFLMLIEARDQRTAESTMTKIASTLESQSSVSFRDETIGGSRFRTMGDGSVTLGYGFIKNTLVIGGSRRALEAAAEAVATPLANDDRFKTATAPLPRRNGGYLYLDAERVWQMLYRRMSDSEQKDFDLNVRPHLEGLQTIAVASEQPASADDLQRGSVFIAFKAE
jgi:hypothetical protein